MTPRDFVYWLQGHLEISGTNALTKKQVAEIRRHIKLVMTNAENRFHQPPEDFQQGLSALLQKHQKKHDKHVPRACAPVSGREVTYC